MQIGLSTNPVEFSTDTPVAITTRFIIFMLMFKDFRQFSIVMAFFLIGGMICGKLHPKDKRDEITIGGMPVSRTPCLNVVNELFGRGVDSNKACDCLLPGYYELVKDDPEELTKFDHVGIHVLPGAKNELVNQLIAECIGDHIVDSTYRMHLTGELAMAFRKQLAGRIRADSHYNQYNPDTLALCLVDSLNDHLTIKDYIGLSTWSDAAAKKLISPCLAHRK